jgi:hypothetical protein
VKIYLEIIFIVLFAITAFGQQQSLMSDTQFDGLKGKVKNVVYERASFDQNGNISNKRGMFSIVTSYDRDGNKFEVVRYEGKTPTYKTTYWRKNGEIFYKGQKLDASQQPDKMPSPPPPPAQGNNIESTTSRDPSFDSRVKPGFDQKGNLIEKLNYGNNGVFNNRRVYEFDAKGNKLKEIVFTGDGQIYNDSTKYIYDSKGLIVQELSFITDAARQESTARPLGKLSYEYVKLDEKGNWLERKIFESMKRGVESEPKLIAIEYQTITYY